MTRRKTVLVVDDNQDGAELLAELIETMGHAARVATSGEAALALLAEAPVDVAILDFSLPDIDGCDLAARIAKLSPKPSRIVMLTGFSSDTHRQRALTAGCTEFIVKPFRTAEIEALLG